MKRENKRKHADKIIRKQKSREFILMYLKENCCVDCGFSNPAALDFDHIGPKTKHISRMLSNGTGIASILKELKHCEVRCANCHRIKTAKDQNWYKNE